MEVLSFITAISLSAAPAPAESETIDQDLRDLMKSGVIDVADDRTDCPDFSGTWAGSCVLTKTAGDKSESVTTDESVVLKQTACSHLEKKGEKLMEIGVAHNKSSSSEKGFRHKSAGLWWDKDGKSLSFAGEIGGMPFKGDTYTKVKGHGKIEKSGKNSVKFSKSVTVKKASETSQVEKSYVYNCELSRDEMN